MAAERCRSGAYGYVFHRLRRRPAVAMAGALACVCCESQQAPEVCDTIPDQVVHVGETATLEACFHDANGDPLSYSVTASPPEFVSLTTAGSTVTIIGFAPGTSEVSVIATDALGLQGEARFRIVVPNRSPEPIGVLPSLRIAARDSALVDAARYFADPDGQDLSYEGISSDTAVARVSGAGAVLTVRADRKGYAAVLVVATDPEGSSATQEFAVTVPNRGPIAGDSIPEMTVEAGETVELGMAAYFSDPDGDSLSYAAVASDPAHVAVAISEGTVAVTALRKGATTVTLAATDTEGLTAALAVTVTVPNRPPESVGMISAETVPVGEARHLDALSLFSDPDGDTLTFAVTTSDSTVAAAALAGEALTIAGRGKGEATLTVTATDTEGLAAAHALTVFVPNRAPVAEQAMPPRMIEAGDSVLLELSPFFADPDGDPLVFEVAAADTSVVQASVTGATLTIRAAAKGFTTVGITAADAGGLAITQALTVTVPNQGPVAVDSIPPKTVEVGETVELGMAACFSDPDGDPLSYTATSSDPARVAVSVSESTVSVTALRKGAATITLTAADPEGLAVTRGFTVTVPNRPPEAVGALSADTVAVGKPRHLDMSSLFSDPDGDTLILAVRTSDSAVVAAVVVGEAVTVAAVGKGEATLTITAIDTEGLAAAQTLTVTVPNRMPVAELAMPPRTIRVGDSVAAELSRFFGDPDGDPLVYEAAALDTSVVRVLLTGAALTIRAAAKGFTTVVITAADSDGMATAQEFAVTVPNRAPHTTGTIPPWDAVPGDTVQIDLAPFFSDPDDDDLAFAAAASDPATIDIGVSGAAMSIEALSRGGATVTVTATDVDGLAAMQSVAVTVRNQPPLPVGSIETQAIEVGDSTAFGLSTLFADPDGDSLTFVVSSSDSTVLGVFLDRATLKLAAIARGEATVTITAVDAAGLAATQTFGVTVPNRAPVPVGTLRRRRMSKSGVMRLTPRPLFADPDGDSIAFEAMSSDLKVAKAWVSRESVLVRAMGEGVATVTILARDPEGLSAEQGFAVHVRGSGGSGSNRPPAVVGTIGEQAMEEGDFRRLVAGSRFSDPDGDALHFTARSSDTAVATATESEDEVVLRAVAQGGARVEVIARDPGGLTATLEFAVTVSEASGVNRAPVVVSAVAPRKLNEDDSITIDVAPYFQDPDNDFLTFTTASSDTAVVAVTVSGSEVMLRAVAPGAARIEATARDAAGLAATVDFDVKVFEPGTPAPICDRTSAVRRKILEILEADDCAAVTSSQLAWITRLELHNADIESLRSRDFAGLTGLTRLELYGNKLTGLPSGVFSGLSSLKVLQMSYNRLASLPASVFSGLTELEELNFSHNDITSLPSGVFDGLSSLKYLFIEANGTTLLDPHVFAESPSLTILFLYGSDFNTLPEGIFSGLTSLEWLTLEGGSLTELRADAFEDLSSLTILDLANNRLRALPEGIFAHTPGLAHLLLSGNDLEELPDRVFDGLSSLRTLWLHGNRIEPMPIEVSLVATSEGHVRATTSVGAPFAIEVPVTVADGAVDGVITIPVGAVESPSWDPGGATTVDIVTMPDPPTANQYTNDKATHPAHHGYVLTKSPDLPLTLGEEDAVQDAAFSLSSYATSIDSSRNTSWIRFSSFTPSDIGRWNALRPEISPIPPARLLMTAVRAACAKSLSPLEPPELIRPTRPM